MDIRHTRSPKRRRVLLTLAVLVVTAGAVTTYAALSRVARLAPEVDGDVIWIGTVERGPLEIEVRAPGRLVPQDERWIVAASEGVVERELVKPGHRVEPGTELLELSNPALRRELLTAELNLRAARASASAFETRLANDVLDLEASVARLHADLQEAELRARTDAQLDAEGLVSQFDVAVGGFRARELQRLYQIEQMRLERRRSAIVVEMDAERARIDMSVAIAADLRRQVDGLTVRAESAGIVTEIVPEVGSRVMLGEPLARIIDPSRLRAELDVPQTRARDIVVGQPARIDLRGVAIEGKVVRIDPSVRDGVVLVEVDLDGVLPDAARAELRVDGLIEIERLGQVLSVRRPSDARENSPIRVFRLRDQDREAVRVEVDLGRLSVNRAQVLQGLDEGDRVILSDMSAFAEADRVRIR